MANYIFIKTRKAIESSKILQDFERACNLLTPTSIKGKSQNIVKLWPRNSNAFCAIQNSESIVKPEYDELVMG